MSRLLFLRWVGAALLLGACGAPGAGQAISTPGAEATPAASAAPAASATATVQATATASPAAPTATAAPAASATATAQATATPSPAAPAATADPAAQSPQVQQAIADLAGRLGVSPQDIAVVRAEEVDWPDGSVGCPQPDMAYIQQVTNGVFIQLRAGGQEYNYHAGGAREPFLCTSKDEVLPEDLPPELRGGGS